MSPRETPYVGGRTYRPAIAPEPAPAPIRAREVIGHCDDFGDRFCADVGEDRFGAPSLATVYGDTEEEARARAEDVAAHLEERRIQVAARATALACVRAKGARRKKRARRRR